MERCGKRLWYDVRNGIVSMREWCSHIALETRVRTREDLEGPAHGGPRTHAPPRARITFLRAAQNALPAPRRHRRLKSDRKGGSKNGPRERRRRGRGPVPRRAAPRRSRGSGRCCDWRRSRGTSWPPWRRSRPRGSIDIVLDMGGEQRRDEVYISGHAWALERVYGELDLEPVDPREPARELLSRLGQGSPEAVEAAEPQSR